MSKTRRIPFLKLNGAGNDFVLIDRSETSVAITPALAARFLDRHFGVGGDQLIILTPGNSVRRPKLEFLNADGSRAEMCGNGTRAAALYLKEFKGIRKDFEFETQSRIVSVKLQGKAICVDMGQPIWDGPRIPVQSKGVVLNHPLRVDGSKFFVNAVSMGNPHCVIIVKNVEDFPVSIIGPKLEHHPLFPKRVNVEFVQLLASNRVRVRVWERGTGETLACGSGACAVAAVLGRQGKAGRALTQDWQGGLLKTTLENDGNIHLSGPAEISFRGTFLI